MKDPLSYTYDGLERELNLLEIHLKEAPKGDINFCQDCIDKHISTSRGFALEGPGFTNNEGEQEKFLAVEKKLREIKGKNYKKDGVKLSQEVRNIRKSLSTCSTCSLSKDLNNPDTFNNDTHTSSRISDYDQLNGEHKEMKAELMQLGMMGAGQFAAEGVKYLAETQFAAQEQYVTIGGGAGLMLLPLFVKKLPSWVKTLSMVAGSNLLASGVVKLIKGTTPIVVAKAGMAKANNNAGLGGYAGKSFSQTPSFGGPTFAGKVTAQNIPSQYARAGILSGAQAFESPEHADLIRVD